MLTITGADNPVHVKNLVDLTLKYPFVEWGILFSNNSGRERYPDAQWKQTAESCLNNLSAHLCGWWAKEVLQNQNFNIITELSPSYKRVQLNYNFGKSKGWDLDAVFIYAEAHPERSIILQYNKSNAPVLDSYRNDIFNRMPKNIHFLYDSSGGRGTEIKTIDNPIDLSYTGYAGGLNTENIADICKKISIHNSNVDCWIDLESGVRSNNQFDLNKVITVLEKTKPFIEYIRR